jgi:hypothetical protein
MAFERKFLFSNHYMLLYIIIHNYVSGVFLISPRSRRRRVDCEGTARARVKRKAGYSLRATWRVT